MRKTNWGIWGTGYIAGRVAQAMGYTQSCNLHSVLSRFQQKADEFAQKYGVPYAYGDIDEMLSDEALDAVYIGTPNASHIDHAIECLKRGKHVLCDKPMVTNSGDMDKLLDAAKSSGKFLMEGMWTHFIPVVQSVKDWIAGGLIGRPLRCNVNFSIVSPQDGWRWKDGVDGGALLDLGVYCLTMASIAFGLDPAAIESTAYIKDGTDIANSTILKYRNDQIAAFSCALDCESDHKAIIAGDKGYIVVKNPFYAPKDALLYNYVESNAISPESNSKFIENANQSYPSTGFQFELDHVSACIREGRKESPVIPLGWSRQMMKLMEKIRSKW